MKRIKLLLLLATMPDEAFDWLLPYLDGSRVGGGIWPDGLGGFMPESREAIVAVRKEAARYLSGFSE